jgi:hypothetical protein
VAKGQKTGGRQKGSVNKRTRETVEKAEASGLMPLDYMLSLLRAEDTLLEDRKWAAQQAAPYVHAKLIASHNTGDQVKKSVQEWLEETS